MSLTASNVWPEAHRALVGRALLVAMLALAPAACRDEARPRPDAESSAALDAEATPSTPATAPPRRVLKEPAPEGDGPAIRRVQIGPETRPVLGAASREALLWRDPVVLSDALTVRVTVPPELIRDEGALRLDVSASVQPEAFRHKDPIAARLTTTGRKRLAAAPVLLSPQRLAENPDVAVVIPVPPRMRGLSALVDVIARPLPAVVQHWPGGPFPVSVGDRLVFGFGIEPEGGSPGWPPVRFRVFGTPAGGLEVPLFDRRLDPANDPRDRVWLDAEVVLSSVASEATTLRFEARTIAAEGAVSDSSFAVFSAPEIVPGRSGEVSRDPERPWNVILVSLDTLRARSVGAYGYARDTTPAIDRRVAQRGAIVRSAVTPVPFTPPSHMSMLTGLEPCAHRVEDRHGTLPTDRRTLAEILHAHGYRTAAFTENGYVTAGAGFARGFDRYFEQRSEESAAPGFAPVVFAEASRWMEREGSRPFFVFIHTYQVHEPYGPPGGYAGLFADDQVTSSYKAEHRSSVDAYDREIRYTDDIVADFLDRLAARGLDERTLLVITSDHGEGFGEHFWTGHGLDLHDEALLVPLLVRAPGLVPEGLVIEWPVGLIDLVPTLLDLLDRPAPPDLQGRSFAALLRGEETIITDRPIVSTSKTSSSIRTRRSKLILGRDGKPSTLYDLETDAQEKRDLRAERPDDVAALEAAYAVWKRHCDALEAQAVTGARPVGERQPGWLINRDEIDEKLRSLGYVE